MLYFMLWTISESALWNTLFWCGALTVGASVILFLVERFLPKENRVPGRVYAAMWIICFLIGIGSILFTGHGSRDDQNTVLYPDVTPLTQEAKETNRNSVKEKIEEQQAQYEQYSDKKEYELQKDSEDYFNTLMKREQSQRNTEK